VPPIYLDHNATAPLLPEVAEAMAECHAAGYANPASQHRAGRRARQVLEDAREGIAALLGADLTSAKPDTLVFTSGGTEANNLAIFGLAAEHPSLTRRATMAAESRSLTQRATVADSAGETPSLARRASVEAPGRIAISAIEHPSVTEPAKELRRRGWQVDVLPVTSRGVLDLAAAEQIILEGKAIGGAEGDRGTPLPRLVSVMLGNNETGAIQPVPRLAAMCLERGILLHTDAVQAVGKAPVHFRRLGVAVMSVAAHKFHGPRGIGALILRHGLEPRPILWGGVQQAGLRPGTEDVALAVGMHAALLAWRREADARARRLAELRDRLEQALCTGWPGLVVHAADAERLPHTLAVAFAGLNRQALMMALDLAGVACSTGSACASGSSDPSPTLVAMGCDAEILESSIRFSLGATTTPEEIDEAARRILRVAHAMRKTPAALSGR